MENMKNMKLIMILSINNNPITCCTTNVAAYDWWWGWPGITDDDMKVMVFI